MNIKRLFLSSAAVFVFALVWNGIIHLGILRDADSILSSIGRRETDRNMLLSLLGTALLSVLFVVSYTRYARQGTVREGVMHGFMFGILAGVLVDLNQYVLYPIPASLALAWFVFGLLEFCIYGLIVGWLYPQRSDSR